MEEVTEGAPANPGSVQCSKSLINVQNDKNE